MPDPAPARVAVVVGASSGLGRALALEYAARGFRVVALARRGEELARLAAEAPAERIRAVVHDVRNLAEIPGVVAEIERVDGPIDTLVYNTGIMPETTPETFDVASDLEVFAVNLHGAMGWIHAVIPLLVRRGHGHIVGISSIAGDRGRRGFLAYNTSKAAFTTLLESYRNRTHRHGVRVTTIKPGYVATPMTAGLTKMFWVASPERAAKEIAAAAEAGVVTRYVLRRWAIIGLIVRLIPSFIFRRLNF